MPGLGTRPGGQQSLSSSLASIMAVLRQAGDLFMQWQIKQCPQQSHETGGGLCVPLLLVKISVVRRGHFPSRVCLPSGQHPRAGSGSTVRLKQRFCEALEVSREHRAAAHERCCRTSQFSSSGHSILEWCRQSSLQHPCHLCLQSREGGRDDHCAVPGELVSLGVGE